jgi:hypothetical protein
MPPKLMPDIMGAASTGYKHQKQRIEARIANSALYRKPGRQTHGRLQPAHTEVRPARYSMRLTRRIPPHSSRAAKCHVPDVAR